MAKLTRATLAAEIAATEQDIAHLRERLNHLEVARLRLLTRLDREAVAADLLALDDLIDSSYAELRRLTDALARLRAGED